MTRKPRKWRCIIKNFDSEWSQRRAKANREFQLGGETFVMREAVRPETLGIRRDIAENAPIEEQMAAMDGLVLSMIEPDDDAEGRWMALRARVSDGLSLADVREVVDWLIENQTGRPPTSQSVSTAGPTRTGTRSMAVSPSRGSRAA